MQPMTINLDGFADQVAEAIAAKLSTTPASPKEPTKIYLNKSEAATLLGVSRATLDDWIANQGLPVAKIGKTYRLKRSDLITWMESHVA